MRNCERFLFVFLFLVSFKSWAAELIFTANDGAITGSYPAGSSVPLKTTLNANMNAGGIVVDFVIINSAGTVVNHAYVYGKSASLTVQTLSTTYTVPTTLASGSYKFSIWVWAPDWSKAYAVNQTPVQFNMGTSSPTSQASGIAVYGGSDQGCTEALGIKKPMSVIVRNSAGQGVANVQVDWTASAGKLSATSSFTNSIGVASVSYTCPSSAQTNTIKATLHSTTNSASFVQTSHIQIYQPTAATLASIPATVPLLKPRTAYDPLAGDGFIPVSGSFTQVSGLSDEFSGTAIDTNKWFTRYVYNNGALNFLNDECERYNEHNTHIMGSGVLKLTARPVSGTCHGPSSTGASYPIFESGMLRSKTTFQYGYFEARVKFPAGLGVWPAFWINPESGWPPEIDILEFVRNDATEYPSMLHSGTISNVWNPSPQAHTEIYHDPNENTQWGYFHAVSPLRSDYFIADWHVISCYWREDGVVTFYYDGVPVHSLQYNWVHNNGTNAGMAHLLLNLAIGGTWPTNGWTTSVPQTEQQFVIDYVRVFQKTGAGILGTSTTGSNLCPATGC